MATVTTNSTLVQLVNSAAQSASVAAGFAAQARGFAATVEGLIAAFSNQTITVNLVSNPYIVGETGGGSTHLDGIDASVYSLGTVMAWNVGGMAAVAAGNPAPRVQYMLVASTLTPGPGVVAALNLSTARWVQIS